LSAFFQQLRERYDLILLDTPPMLPTADSLILSVYADAVVLVIDLTHTTREALRTAHDRMAHAQISVLGFIEA
jgi:Mrp family chromosome partitioning ATPase